MRYHELLRPSAKLDVDHYELFRIAVVPLPENKGGMVASCIGADCAEIITPTIAAQALATAAIFFIDAMKPADPVQALAELRKAFDEVLTQPQNILPPGVKP